MGRESVRIVRGQIQTLYTLGTLGGLSEAELLELFLTRGDDVAEDAFAALVHRLGPMVLAVSRRMLPCAQDAEDAFQATFLILARRAASIGRRDRLANWLYGVAFRTSREARRRAARQHARERRLMNVSNVEVENAPREFTEDMLSAFDEELNRLPPRYRTALVACELEGKSRHDAAIELGLPEGTLSTHLARGRKMLRDRLLRRGVSLGVGPFAGLAQPITVINVPERLAGSTVRVALSFTSTGIAAGTIPANVASLADGVLKMMMVTRSVVILASVAAVAMTAVVAGTAVLTAPHERPMQTQDRIAPEPQTPAKAAQIEQAKDARSRARVQGVVVDEAGKPVSGIEVRVNNAVDRQQRGITDATGQFDFLVGIPPYPDTCLLAASRDRTWQGMVPRVDLSSDATKPRHPVKIVLKPAKEIAVRVRDRDGKPVADAAIAFLTERHPVANGQTDADGRWTVRVPVESKLWLLFAGKANMGFDYAVAGKPGDGEALMPLPDQVNLTLDGAKTTRVKAVDGDGKPIAGVNIGAWSLQKKGHKVFNNWPALNAELWPATGKDGIAVLDWLPEDCVEGFGLDVHAEGLYALERTWVRGDRPVELCTITLLPVETLSGRVTYADGRPAAGILVSASGNGAGQSGCNRATRTNADGRYAMQVESEQAYVVAVNGQEWAAPYRADFIVHAGKPVDGVDFVLGRPTRVHGRLFVGKEGKPGPNCSIRVFISQELASDEIRIKGEAYRPNAEMTTWVQTGAHDEYEIYLGPGEYRIMGPLQENPVTLTIPAVNPPAEITQDIHEIPLPTTGPFVVQVVDTARCPVAGAVINGIYPSTRARRWFAEQKTNERGRLQTERTHTPLVLHAKSADGKLAGVTRIDAETTESRLVVGPVVTAAGRLLDLDGKALEQKYLHYGIRVHDDEDEDGPFREAYGGAVQTGADGHFILAGLVLGQTYHLTLEIEPQGFRIVTQVTPRSPGPIDLGELRVDNVLNRPYIPPTPEQRTANSFSSQASTLPITRKNNLLVEARREHTRPLLLLGRPVDAACIDLFRAFYDEPAQTESVSKSKGDLPLPSELLWEFDLASLDMDQPGVRQLALELGVSAGQSEPPLLVVLSNDGSVTARFPLRLDEANKLDRRALSSFLFNQKLTARNAENMLAEALSQAKTDNKKVFLIFSASWCGPCRRLARLLDTQKPELEQHYVFVKLDIDRDDYAGSLRDRYPESKNGGIPWFAILDATGKELITSNIAKLTRRTGSTNIGYPTTRKDFDHFAKMLKQTAPGLADETVSALLRKAATKEE